MPRPPLTTNATILLYGHDPILMASRARLLAQEGHRVRRLDAFACIREALEGVRPDLVILCQTCSGTENEIVLACCSEMHQGIKAVLMTREHQALQRLMPGVWHMDGKSPRGWLLAVDTVLAAVC